MLRILCGGLSPLRPLCPLWLNATVRAAAILGLGSSPKRLRAFQKDSKATWLLGLPESSASADAILIFGGDGTIHRHLAQLVRLNLPVLVVPCGSGNDFARALQLKSVGAALSSWRRFEAGNGNLKNIDLGVITPLTETASGAAPRDAARTEAPHSPARYFSCVAGVGLDVEIARRANRLPRWLRAHGGYALSLPAALLGFAALPMKILLPGNAQPWEIRSAKPTVLAAFANTPAYGGGMQVAPCALLDDGQLDVCLVANVDKFKLFCRFPTVYFGRHLNVSEVDYFQAERLRVETEKPLDVYADGEYVCQTPVEVSVARNALQVLLP